MGTAVEVKTSPVIIEGEYDMLGDNVEPYGWADAMLRRAQNEELILDYRVVRVNRSERGLVEVITVRVLANMVAESLESASQEGKELLDKVFRDTDCRCTYVVKHPSALGSRP